MKSNRIIERGKWAGALVLLVGMGLLAAGCESDAVAPQDEIPAPTVNELAQQAALVAVGVAKVGPELLTYSGGKTVPAELGVYPYSFPPGGDISGTIVLEYFEGGAEGTHSHWDDADFGMLYTPEGEAVTAVLDLGLGLEPVFSVAFDLHGPIDRGADTATVSGSGTFTSQAFVRDFTLTNVLLTEVSSYPEGGSMDFVAGSLELTVTYDGTRFASAGVPGGPGFLIDLDTGVVTSSED